MWLENLKELKKAKEMTTKQIAEITKIPESTLKRIFSGDTPDPYISTIHRIVTALGGSLDYIFADTNVVITADKPTAEAGAEIEKLKAKIAEQEAKIMLLEEQIKHKEEILALIDYFAKIKKE